MSRPRYYWFGFIQKILRRYPDKLAEENTAQSNNAIWAIKKALGVIEKRRDGPDKIRLVEMVYFKESHTLAGAALVLHISERTAQQWNSEFVYLVAEKMGHL